MYPCRHCFAESAVKSVSQAAPEKNCTFPRRRAASKRVSTPAGAGKDIPCRFVKRCPACGQRTVAVTPLPLPFLDSLLLMRDWIVSRSSGCGNCGITATIVYLRNCVQAGGQASYGCPCGCAWLRGGYPWFPRSSSRSVF